MADVVDKNKFNLKYLFVGDGKKDWYKALGTGWRLFIIVAVLALIGIVTWKLFFEKKNNQNIQIGAGSTVTIKQGEQKAKWAWWIPHPFVDIYVYKENDRQGVGSKFGGHWEF